MADFKAEYGYDLGVPVNWSAYEDIAAFFTGRDLCRILAVDGDVWGNMDYGKKDPSARLALHRCVDVDGRDG
jgi:glycerol transport system substrate-binding protein